MPELPDKMPPRIAVRVPLREPFHVFGTIAYGVSAITSLVSVIMMGAIHWTPPWYFLMPAFLYIFINTAIICLGRIDANRNIKSMINDIYSHIEENKRRMN